VRKALIVLAAVTAAALFVGHSSSNPRPRPLVLRGPAPPHSLLAFRHTGNSGYLVRVNAETLRLMRGPRLMIAGHSFGWSLSPDGRLLALGDNSGGEVWLVNTRRLQLVGRIQAADYGGVLATAWIDGRLLAITELCCYSDEPANEEGLRLAVLDPQARRKVVEHPIEGSLKGFAFTQSALVLLVSPRQELGSARLLIVGAQGRVQTVILDRIPAGQEWEPAGSSAARSATPGLALDTAGGRAFVVGAGAPVAEIDLSTLAVSYHDVSTPISLLSRVGAWLEPPAEAKVPRAGPVRSARWLGNGFLAVWGHETHVSGEGRDVRVRDVAAGVKLIDTRNWTVRTIDPRASAVTVTNDTLLTYGANFDSGVQKISGVGLTGYDVTGSARYHVLGSAALYRVHALGPKFVVQENPRFYTIRDARSGRVLHRIKGAMPEPLVR
jgi:hypothetical protein